MRKLVWSGGHNAFLTAPDVQRIGRVSLGRYGGTGGKNEDGALVWTTDNWTLATALDGHASSQSVSAVLWLLEGGADQLVPICEKGDVLELQRKLITLLAGAAARDVMASVRGETACLVAYQSGPNLLWLSIGDNTLYLLHPELARMGQHTLTTRNFFEWIGERNSLSGSVPYFSTGVRQLRQGRSDIVLVTDGIQEMPGAPFHPAAAFAETFNAGPDPLKRMLNRAETVAVRDSCTMIAWTVDNPEPGLVPSG